MTAAERGRNRGPRGDRGLDAIRTAAWLSASASGLAEASSSLPPLSGTMAGKAATRRRRDASASRPRRPRRNAGRRDGRARAAEPLQTSRSGVSSNGAAPEEEHFYDLVGEDDDEVRLLLGGVDSDGRDQKGCQGHYGTQTEDDESPE